MRDVLTILQAVAYGALLVIVVLTFPLWAMRKPVGVLDTNLRGNSDLVYFATDAPDTFVIFSPGLHSNRLILPASERMADMVVSPDGTVVWTATKSGFVDRYEIPLDRSRFTTGATLHRRIAPVLSAIALSANGRFVAVGYGDSEDYNSRNIKILPAGTVSLADELADFSVAGDIQDIVANPVEDIFYIINSHSDRVRVYNADRFRLEPDIIELGNSPGNFVVRPDGLRAYGAMNARKAIAIVDLETNETVDYVALGFSPYAMAFNVDGSHLYIASRDSSDVAIVDTGSDEIVSTFRLPPRLEGVLEFNFAEMIGVSADERFFYAMPKRAEFLVYDISCVLDPARASERPVMVQSQVLAANPFYMEIVRGHSVPGV